MPAVVAQPKNFLPPVWQTPVAAVQSWRLMVVMLLFAACWMSHPAAAQTTACCDDPSCHTTAANLANNLRNAVIFLGTYTPGLPVDFKRKKQFLDSLKVARPNNYAAIVSAAQEISKWSNGDPAKRSCLSREYANFSDDELAWINYFLSSFFVSGFRSPEFARGAGLRLYTGAGVRSLFTGAERFASLSGVLLSYTIAPKGQTTGGTVRVMLGPAFYYSATKTFLLVQPRFEFRLLDLANEFTSIGCLKLVAQGGFQHRVQLAGLGLGAEVAAFSLHLTDSYLFRESAHLLQLGVGYSFLFRNP